MLGWEFPPFRSGGLGTHIYHLTKSMAKLGMDITFLLPKNPMGVECDYMKIVEIDPSLMIGPYSLTTEVKENYSLSLFDDVWKYNMIATQYAAKLDFDLIHCHDWMTSMAGVNIKREKKKPLIITIHSTEYDRSGCLCPNQWIVDREQHVIDYADLIITVSQRMKQQLIERYNADPGKIVVIYNAIDTNGFSASRAVRSFAGDYKIVLFLGRLTIQKGPDFFLKAAKKVLEKEQNVRFVIGGKGDMYPQLIREAIGLGIMDKVMFLGFVPDEELPKLYALSDVYVLPSVSEPFGITALEAIASKTPTIISKQSGVSEVLNHVFTVDFWDVNEMANKILALLKYDSLHNTMSGNGHKEVSRYTWGGIANETIERAYNRVLH